MKILRKGFCYNFCMILPWKCLMFALPVFSNFRAKLKNKWFIISIYLYIYIVIKYEINASASGMHHYEMNRSETFI